MPSRGATNGRCRARFNLENGAAMWAIAALRGLGPVWTIFLAKANLYIFVRAHKRLSAMTQNLRLFLALSISANVLLVWVALHKPKPYVSTDVDQTRMELYRVLPKDFYTRNELALALTQPTNRPIVRDCMVRTMHTVYVFDRRNTLIGMYEPGPNPFIPDPVASLERGYKCDPDLLDAQTQQHIAAAKRSDHHLEVSKALLQKEMAQEGETWAVRHPAVQK